ncbi:hypothetical protein HK104_006024 [Borealophlyctis nickersoniae]|nr:hypothetical protein HK104_006024 [Borealophlyctis nickersoniae]
MAASKKSHTIGFPIFAVAFAPRKPRLVIGGGGGPTRAGVKNAMIVYDVNEKTLGLSLLAEHQFGKDDDGCMSVAVHPKEKTFVVGVNSPEAIVTAGENQNCRVFQLRNERFIPGRTFKTLDSTDSFHHQKVAKFSADGSLLMTGTTDGKLSVWAWPDMKPAIPAINQGGEISDADFDQSGKKVG